MKIFQQRELREAIAYAAAGGQALHVCSSAQFVTAAAPGCFKRSKQFAHLLDQNAVRLVKTAKRLGVRVVVVERSAEPRQHVDLCGKPLERAITQAGADEWDRQQLGIKLEPVIPATR